MAEKQGFHHISVATSRNSFTGRTNESETRAAEPKRKRRLGTVHDDQLKAIKIALEIRFRDDP